MKKYSSDQVGGKKREGKDSCAVAKKITQSCSPARKAARTDPQRRESSSREIKVPPLETQLGNVVDLGERGKVWSGICSLGGAAKK